MTTATRRVYHVPVDPAALDTLAHRHGIVLLLQFGSSVTGREHAGSDLDLAVLLERFPESADAHADLVADLQTLVPGREIDVAIVNRADPLFLKQITADCRLLYGAESRLHELRIYAFKRHQDHRRFLAMERDYVRRAVETRVP